MKTLVVICVISVLLICGSPILAQSANSQQAPSGALSDVLAKVTKVKGLKLVSTSALQPPADLACLAVYGISCATAPQQIRSAYGLTPILQAGYTGAGQTIVIVDSFGSPTIAADLAAFDAAYGLPDPPSFKVEAPLGTVPFDPTNSDMVRLGVRNDPGRGMVPRHGSRRQHCVAHQPGLRNGRRARDAGISGAGKICRAPQIGKNNLSKLGRDREHFIYDRGAAGVCRL